MRDRLPCCRWVPGSSVRPRRDGRDWKADLLLVLFLAASCSVGLERPCWFSQSRRAPKGRRVNSQAASWSTQPLGVGTPRRVCWREESREGEATTSHGIKENSLGVPGLLQRTDCVVFSCFERLTQVPLTAPCPVVQTQIRESLRRGMAPLPWLDAQASLLNTCHQTLL